MYNKVVGNKAKGRISKRVFQENKASQTSGKTNISCPLIRTRTKCLFFENFGVLCFLETPVLRFALLPYYRRSMIVTDTLLFLLDSVLMLFLEARIYLLNQ